jgi:hypothetical protein
VRLRVDLVASVAKDLQRQELNEDAFALGKTCVALSDGASESYDSQSWAQLLTQAYTLDQRVSAQWVAERVRAYLNSTDFATLSWSRQAAFERGSFATLLGLELAPNGLEVDVLAIGDSLAVHVRDGVVVESFPFKFAEEFDARPQLMSTLSTANAFVGEPDFFTKNSTTWQIQTGDQILLVTDAIGHWILAHKEALADLCSIPSVVEFEQMVVARRQDRSMRLDDSTILRILVDADDQEQKT